MEHQLQIQTSVIKNNIMLSVTQIYQNAADELLKPYILFATFVLLLVSKKMFSERSEKSRVAELVDRFPGPPKWFFMGSSIYLAKIGMMSTSRILSCFTYMQREWGDVYKLWAFSDPKIVVNSAEVAMKLLKEGAVDEKSSELVNASHQVNGYALVALPLSIHHKRRRQWTPGFSRRQLESYSSVFSLEAISLRDKLERYVDSQSEFDVCEHVLSSGFRIIAVSAFGEDATDKLTDAVVQQQVDVVHKVSVGLTSRQMRAWLWNDLVYYSTPEGREVKRNIESYSGFNKQMIADHIQYRNGNLVSESKWCFLDFLIDLRDKGELTDTEMHMELNNFIAAGYDTSALSICYALFLLSLEENKIHQDKIVAELEEVLGQNFKSPDYSITTCDTKKMKYMECCIKEALRLFPVVPVLLRRCVKDTEVGPGQIIPKGVDVYLALHNVHHDTKYFPNPEQFLPERYQEGCSPAFMTFALGARNCIGQVFAMYEMKVILAQLLKTYEWSTRETRESFKTIFQTLQAPADGVQCKIRKRL